MIPSADTHPTAPDAAAEATSASTPSGTTLTQSQKRYLRGMCHHLKPLVMVGGKGVTPAVTDELDVALKAHELVKVKLAGSDKATRRDQLASLLAATGAETVQQIGHMAGLFRRNPESPRLALPR